MFPYFEICGRVVGSYGVCAVAGFLFGLCNGALVQILFRLKLQLTALGIDYSVLQVCQALVGDDFESSSEFPPPCAVEVEEQTFFYVSFDEGVQEEGEIAFAEVAHYVLQFFVECVGEQQ